MNALPSSKPSSRLIRDGIRIRVFRPVPTDLGAERSQAAFIIPMFLQSQAPVAPAAVTFTATFMAR